MKTASRRASDGDFDKEFKDKEAARKRKYRADQKAAFAAGIAAAAGKASPVAAAAGVTDADERKRNSVNMSQDSKKSCQALMGLLQRKKASKEKNESISSLLAQKVKWDQLQDRLEEEIADLAKDLKRIETENAQLRTKMKENDVWLKETFKYCTTATKKGLKTAYQIASSANELPKGNTLRLLRNTGINFSKKLPENPEQTSELKKMSKSGQ